SINAFRAAMNRLISDLAGLLSSRKIAPPPSSKHWASAGAAMPRCESVRALCAKLSLTGFVTLRSIPLWPGRQHGRSLRSAELGGVASDGEPANPRNVTSRLAVSRLSILGGVHPPIAGRARSEPAAAARHETASASARLPCARARYRSP